MKITLEGQYTVERADELRQQLMAVMKEKEEVEISLAKVERADLTFFQLLHAAMKSRRQKGRSMKFSGDLPEALMFQARMCGLAELFHKSAA
ncbi:MAG: STAS domain-containing protein [Magnetococcales bacterium]|nr:STAS domain-containing protein [Magnetococcales bacterium]